jgi:GMP synthase (glutamine-hydrolysing)
MRLRLSLGFLMQDVVAIRHVAFEHLGTLAPVLSGRGFRIRYLDAGSADLGVLDPTSADLLVVLGGPIGACDEAGYPFLVDELRLVERRLESGRPLLGICLGAQLMARALGARVYPGSAKEIGWSALRLNAAGERSCLGELARCGYQVMHWHGDTFDLPQSAQGLAATEITPNQAFSVGNTALGLQFHLEVDANQIEHWLIGHAHEIAAAPGTSVATLRADSARLGPALAKAAGTCLSRWLETAGLAPPAVA